MDPWECGLRAEWHRDASGVTPVCGDARGEAQTSAPTLCFTAQSGCTVFFPSSVSLTSVSLLQIGTQNSLEILEDPKAEVVDEIAAKLGLRKVRMCQISCVCLCVAGRWSVILLQLHGVTHTL